MQSMIWSSTIDNLTVILVLSTKPYLSAFRVIFSILLMIMMKPWIRNRLFPGKILALIY